MDQYKKTVLINPKSVTIIISIILKATSRIWIKSLYIGDVRKNVKITHQHDRRWRARWDSNPRSSAPQADVLSRLDHEPTYKSNTTDK